MNSIIVNIALAIAAISASASSTTSSQQVQTSVYEIANNYKNMSAHAPVNDEENECVVLACDQIVFIDWAEKYLEVLNATQSLDPNAIGQPLIDFGQLYFQLDDDLPVFDLGSKGLVNAIKTELPNARAKANIADADATKMNIADIQIDLFEQNLNLCSDPDFVTLISTMAPLGNTSTELPAGIYNGESYTVSWVKSPAGGIKPIRNMDDSQLCGAGTCEITSGHAPAPQQGTPVGNYQQFLNAIRQHKTVVYYGGQP